MSCASMRLASARLNWSRETISAKCSRRAFMRSSGAPREIPEPEAEQPQAGKIRRTPEGNQSRDRGHSRPARGAEPPRSRAHREPQRQGHGRQSRRDLEGERAPARLGLVDPVLPELAVEQARIQAGAQAYGEREPRVRADAGRKLEPSLLQ